MRAGSRNAHVRREAGSLLPEQAPEEGCQMKQEISMRERARCSRAGNSSDAGVPGEDVNEMGVWGCEDSRTQQNLNWVAHLSCI
jgi:hypothetical protein